jgi:type I restriction enzyme S subunit
VPSTEREQRRIAAILDKADAIRRKREQSLALADDLLKSAFLEMFGDPATNPKGFRPRKLSSMLAMPLRNGISPSSKGQIEAEVLTLSAITGSSFDASQKKVGRFVDAIAKKDQVSGMDFYICRGNGSPDLVGRGFFASTDMPGVAFPDTMIAARPNTDELEREFLQIVWNSSHVRSQIVNAARTTNGTYKINQTATENIEFPLPPASMQKEFSRRAAVIRDVHAKAIRDLAAATQLFQGLSQRAFRGEL